VKANISGYEAVEDGLNAGGIDQFVCNVSGEPLRNAEKAICKGSFFASTHQRTACLISEADVDVIRYATEKKENQNAAFEIIVLGRELNIHVLSTLRGLSVPLFAAEDVSDVRRMTADALMYSELRRMPVAVYIPVRLLRSRQTVQTSGSYCCDDLWELADIERSRRIDDMERKYNRIINDIGDGDNSCECLVIGISGCAHQICEAIGKVKGVGIVKLDMFGTNTKDAMSGKCSKVMVMGHGSTYITQILKAAGRISNRFVAVELGTDKLHELSEIKAALRGYISSVDSISKYTSRENPSNENPSRKNPSKENLSRLSVTTLGNQMCGDCPYRDEIKEILKACGGINVYEDIYCERHGTIVRSGLTTASSAYSGQMILTNRRDCYYSGLDVRILAADCTR